MSINVKRRYTYPVDALHSTVLGYTCRSETGKLLWAELDWRGVRQDGGIHMMNMAGGEYLHVRCKYSPEKDGPLPIKYHREYRVRCRHQIGTRWRGGEVVDVKVVKRAGKWLWIVEVMT